MSSLTPAYPSQLAPFVETPVSPRPQAHSEHQGKEWMLIFCVQHLMRTIVIELEDYFAVRTEQPAGKVCGCLIASKRVEGCILVAWDGDVPRSFLHKLDRDDDILSYVVSWGALPMPQLPTPPGATP